MASRARWMFTTEFKAETVELIRSSGRSVGEVCRDLDLTETAVRRWVQQAEIDAGKRPGLATAEREELARLRREVLVLREEREILKKRRPLSRRRRPGEPVPVHRGREGRLPGRAAVSGAQGLDERVLRLGTTTLIARLTCVHWAGLGRIARA